MLQQGDALPKFKLPDQSGQEKSFKDLTGKKGLVLFVYSRDNTSG
ncbi:MAG: redoxin domain-containing protein [Deltaproteobacteria bacterium]|nr:redoxin domain-containing protein [Deltaproteobacteria bacterium]